jgi:gliding motility-associated-like protein
MKMKNYISLIIFIFLVQTTYAQPANDNCSGAINIGALPNPGPCVGGLQNGNPTTLAGTTNGATAGSPFIYQSGCQGSAPTMNSPSNDVWYQFTATGTTVNINVSGFPNANIALWSGTCGALNGYACSIANGGGNGSLVATQIQIGNTYYISIGGNTPTQTSNFSLSVDNDIDCNNCLTASNITVNPQPINGAYQPGQVVNFCYQLTGWEIQNTNWFHGVQITMGSGWTGTISNTTVPTACQGSGSWGFYSGGIGVVNGTNWGPGFYFETTAGQNNPVNNYGDNCEGTNLNWTFCFSLTVAAGCSPGSNLNVTINTSGDGESGSWTSAGCSGDYPTYFNAVGSCCAPTMNSTSTCAGQSAGTATATPVGTSGPYTYSWSPSGGTNATASNLSAGNYTVTVVDANNCSITNSVTVSADPTPTSFAGNDVSICSGQSATIGTNSTAGHTYSWSPATGLSSTTISNPTITLTNLGNAPIFSNYTVTTTNTATGCSSTDVIQVVTNPIPAMTSTDSLTKCSGDPVDLFFGSTVPSTYTWVATPNPNVLGESTFNQISNVLDDVIINNTSTAKDVVYTVFPTSTAGCTGASQTVVITVQPSPNLSATPETICAGDTATLTAIGTPSGGYFIWNGAGNTSSYQVSPLVTTTYSVVYSLNGCLSKPEDIDVTVNPIPTVSVADQDLCLGDSLNLVASGSPAGGSYQWTNGPATANYMVSPNSNTSYEVTYTLNNCVSPSDTTTISVYAVPTISSNSGTICTGDSILLSGVADLPGGVFQWAGGPSQANQTVSPLFTTIYTLNYSLNGCPSDPSYSTVIVNSRPTVNASDGVICQGDSIKLTATSNLNGGIYQWTNGPSLADYTVSPSGNTTYSVIYTYNGCTSDLSYSTVSVNPIPTILLNSPEICFGESATLIASGSPIGGNYKWINGPTTPNYTVSPNDTTQYAITYTLNNCTSDTVITEVIVNPIPSQPITNPIFYCINDTSNPLTATADAGHELIWYGLDSTGGTASSTAPIPNTTAIDTFIYYVSQFNTNTGCESPRVNIEVIIYDLPTPPTVTNIAYCLNNQAAPLTATPLPGFELVWFGTAETGGTASPDAPIPSTNSIGTTSYYVAQINPNTGCISPRARIDVLINSTPNLIISNPTPICYPSTVNITHPTITNGTSGGGILSYWNDIVGTIELLEPNQISESGTYYIKSTLGTGCVDIKPVEVVIHSLPQLTINAPEPICDGETINLTDEMYITTNASGNTYSYWNDSLGLSPLTSPESVSSTGIYYIQIKSEFGCSTLDQIEVIVHPLPNVYAGEDTILCAGNSIVLNGSGASSYSWNQSIFNGVTFTPDTNLTYTVTGTSPEGCSAQDSLSIIIESLPEVTFSADVKIGCSPLTVNFTNDTPNMENCLWEFSNGTTASGCGTISATFEEPGCYDVQLTTSSENGCSSSAGKIKMICVEADPIAAFFADPYEMDNFSTTSTMQNMSTGAYSYYWNFGDYTSSIEFEPVHEFPSEEGGSYTITLTAFSPFGCESIATQVITIKEQLIFYVPNSFSPDGNDINDFFTAKFFSGYDPTEFTLYIFDRWGELIFESHDPNIGWKGDYNLSNKKAQDGTYTWKIVYKTKLKDEAQTAIGHVNLLR